MRKPTILQLDRNVGLVHIEQHIEAAGIRTIGYIKAADGMKTKVGETFEPNEEFEKIEAYQADLP